MVKDKTRLVRTDNRREPKLYDKSAYRIAVQGLDGIFHDINMDTIQKIHEKAMENLYESTSWPPSIQGDSIKENVRIIIHKTEGHGNTGFIEYFSPHAAMVEYGGVGGIAEPRGDKPFPIGQQQYGPGGVLGYAQSVTLQQGKHYLQRAIDEVTNSGYVETRVTFGLKKIMRNYLRNL